MGANVSNQQTDQNNEQTTINVQTSDDEVKNTNKEENIQDYTTYIRLSTRNVNDLATNVKTNLKVLASANQKNTADIKGCVDFEDTLDIVQKNTMDKKIEKSFQNMIQDINTLKSQSSQQDQTSTTSGQSSDTDQSGTASTDQGNDQEQEDKQKADQTKDDFKLTTYNSRNVLIDQMYSPIKLVQAATNMINLHEGYKPSKHNYDTKRKSSNDVEEFDIWFHQILRNKINTNVREGFCFSLVCASNQQAKQENIQYAENRQESKKLLENNNEISNKIHSAYDKVSQIYNETKKKTDVNTTDETSGDSSQTNEFVIDTTGSKDPCSSVFKKAVTVDQENDMKQTIVVNNIIQTLSSADVDNDTMAYMSDMMNLTQSASAGQTTDDTTKQGNTQGQTNDQTSSQSITSFGSIIAIVVLAVVAIVIIKLVISAQSNQGQSMIPINRPQTNGKKPFAPQGNLSTLTYKQNNRSNIPNNGFNQNNQYNQNNRYSQYSQGYPAPQQPLSQYTRYSYH